MWQRILRITGSGVPGRDRSIRHGGDSRQSRSVCLLPFPIVKIAQSIDPRSDLEKLHANAFLTEPKGVYRLEPLSAGSGRGHSAATTPAAGRSQATTTTPRSRGEAPQVILWVPFAGSGDRGWERRGWHCPAETVSLRARRATISRSERRSCRRYPSGRSES
jgi:hypothetical protein